MQRKNIYRPHKDNHIVDPSQPIFYIIQHVPSGKYYAGYKKNSKPFMTASGYRTSSTIVHKIIHSEGLNVWKILKIRYFQMGQEAYDYEVKFLHKVNASKNPAFFNQTNGNDSFYMTEEIKRKISISNKGKSHGRKGPMSDDHKRKIAIALKGRVRSVEHCKNLSLAGIGKHSYPCSLITANKISNALKGKPSKLKGRTWSCPKIAKQKLGKRIYSNGSMRKMFMPGQEPTGWLLSGAAPNRN